jgi:hypothetical protein
MGGGVMYRLEPCKDSLKIYYDNFNFRHLDWNYETLYKHCEAFDIYGLYRDNELIGCLFFQPYDDGVILHLAVNTQHRGRWSFHWDAIKEWMLEKYRIVYGVAHVDDVKNNKILKRSGFRLFDKNELVIWYKLWA